jgi:hypothetical protein
VKLMQVMVLVPVDVTGYGRVEDGMHDLPEELAQLLVERGFAVPTSPNVPAPSESAGDTTAKKKK